jgi:predicted NBD/HSP70 family sugar kinase
VGSPSALRKLNDRAALYALLESGPLTRLDLEQAISVSRPAAAELLRRLEESGLARRAGYRPGGPGPQAQLWSIAEGAAYAAGLDVNDTGIDAVIADLGGAPVGTGKSRLAPGDDPAAAVRDLLETVAADAGLTRADVRQVVVGISGSVDPATGRLSHAEHIPEWNGFDVRERLTQVLEVPVAVENDVKLVLSDESIRGRAVGCRDVLLLWMGQGVAIAIIADGRLLRGSHGSAGEMGVVPVSADGPFAGDLLATVGIAALAREHGLPDADPAALVARAASPNADPQHDGFLSALADVVVDVLASPVALVDPDLVILAGDHGLAGGDELAARVRTRLHQRLVHRPRIVAGTGYDNSVRQGALDESLRRLREKVFADARHHRPADPIHRSTESTSRAADLLGTGSGKGHQ